MKISTLHLLAGAALCALLGLHPAQAAGIAPTPRSLPIPISPTNRPFLGAERAQRPLSLGAAGYIEEEFQVVGSKSTAAPGGANSRGPSEFSTRMLVRRPLDIKRASGTVIVELLESSRGYDRAPVWGGLAERLLRHGDIWVGITVDGAAVSQLKRFDSVRYAALDLEPAPAPGCPRANADSSGAAQDVIAQSAALLRSSSHENPLSEYDVRWVIGAAAGNSAATLQNFIALTQQEQRLGNDHSLFDGFLRVGGPSPACPADEAKLAGAQGSPEVVLVAQADFPPALRTRVPDSDDPNTYRRRYEVAGARSLEWEFAGGEPALSDLRIASFGPVEAVDACARAAADNPLGAALVFAYRQLVDYVTAGVPMATAPLLETEANGAPRVDSRGTAVGGLRLPALILPLAAYPDVLPAANSVCGSALARRLDSAELKTQYGNRSEYLRRIDAATDQAVAARWLELTDGVIVKQLARRLTPPF